MTILCGNHPGHSTRHATVAEVRDCYGRRYMDELEARAEYEAELRNERYFEERGSVGCVCRTMALDGSGCLCGAS